MSKRTSLTKGRMITGARRGPGVTIACSTQAHVDAHRKLSASLSCDS
jgi:hypothetical protein